MPGEASPTRPATRPTRLARPARLARLAGLAALALACSACERGCLTAWLSERGSPRSIDPTGGGAAPRGSAARSAPGGFDLAGTDCSDGLARCAAGRVEISVAAHIPEPCVPRENPGACSCPWRASGECARGCVKDDLEVVASPEVATIQLCAPDPAAPAVRPLLATELSAVTVCADEGVRCTEGIVTVCTARGQPARAVGACVEGCAPGITVDHGPLVNGDGTASILCRRAHAERR